MTDTDGEAVQPVGSIVSFLADNALSHLVIGPLTVLYWRGTWEFINRNLMPDQPEVSAWICCVIGNLGLVTLAVSQNLWKTHVTVEKTCSPHWCLGYHLYTYLVGLFNVFQWRGLWQLLDLYTGVNEISCWFTLAVGQCTLWLFRCSKCVISPPLAVEMDKNPEFFEHPGRFNAKFSLSKANVFDSIFTIFVIHHMTVFYWRGLWSLLDIYLFPSDGHSSAVAGLLAAFLLHATLCPLQLMLNRVFRFFSSSTHRKEWHWLLESAIYFLGNPVCVAHWRGVWQLCTEFANPEFLDLVDVATHFLGIGVLMLMMCAQSVTVRGCSVDGVTPDEEGCMFPNKYFRHWMQQKKESLLQQQEHQHQHLQPLQHHQQKHHQQRSHQHQQQEHQLLSQNHQQHFPCQHKHLQLQFQHQHQHPTHENSHQVFHHCHKRPLPDHQPHQQQNHRVELHILPAIDREHSSVTDFVNISVPTKAVIRITVL